MQEFNRITRNPLVMGGKACIRGMRVTVGMIVGQIAEGATPEELLAEFPYIEREDITQALRYNLLASISWSISRQGSPPCVFL